MSGGDFIARGEAAVCQRRRIEDRVQVVRDLERVMMHLGESVAADQMGLSVGDLPRIITRKMAIGQPLLIALYGPGGARVLPSLLPRDAGDADVDKVFAAIRARAPVPVLAVATVIAAPARPVKPAATPTPALVAGSIDRSGHEAKILADAGVTRAEMVAILRRVQAHFGTWPQAGMALGMGTSTLQNLSGGHARFSFRAVEILLRWAVKHSAADSKTGTPMEAVSLVPGPVAEPAPANLPSPDAVAPVVAIAAKIAGDLPEPDSTAVRLAPCSPSGRGMNCAAVEGAALPSPPPNIPLLAGQLRAALAEQDADLEREILRARAHLAALESRRAEALAGLRAIEGLVA